MLVMYVSANYFFMLQLDASFDLRFNSTMRQHCAHSLVRFGHDKHLEMIILQDQKHAVLSRQTRLETVPRSA